MVNIIVFFEVLISLGLCNSLLMVLLTLSSTMCIFLTTDIIVFFQNAIRNYELFFRVNCFP